MFDAELFKEIFLDGAGIITTRSSEKVEIYTMRGGGIISMSKDGMVTIQSDEEFTISVG